MAEQRTQHPQMNEELPTYDALAAQEGPNSRFGRWRSWVEKRAAERYAEDTPEKQKARQMKGWGPHVDTETSDRSTSAQPPITIDAPSSPNGKSGLKRTQTTFSKSSSPKAGDPQVEPLDSYITVGQALPPSHLHLHSFGSRFLPHLDVPILSFLPLFDDTKLLMGHMNGLSVLDLDPQTTSSESRTREPRRRDIWYGEGVYQLALLEHEGTSTATTPKGVILALVGAEPPEVGSDKDSKEPHKEIRMYNLASLASITRWATTGKDHEPLDLSRPKQKTQRSMSRGLRTFSTEGYDASPRSVQPSYPEKSLPPPPPPKDPPRSAPVPKVHRVKIKAPEREESARDTTRRDDRGTRMSPMSSVPPIPPPKDSPKRRHASKDRTKVKSPLRETSIGSDWEVIVGRGDLPFRWATDYVPLASPGSRLDNLSVTFFEFQKITDEGRVTARLIVATKQNIFLYESVRGERAFRFVKEFYTPLPAHSARFVYQSQPEPPREFAYLTTSFIPDLSETYSGRQWRGGGTRTDVSSRRASFPGPQTVSTRASWNSARLCLFVVFEKKAGLIRVSDSSVGEVDLWEDSGPSPSSGGGTSRRSVGSFEGLAINKDGKGSWAPPAEITLPLPQSRDTVKVYLLTRGRYTYIVPSPLPMPLAAHAPLRILAWGMHPNDVVPRACSGTPGVGGESFLQVTALSEDGVEVQELPLGFLTAHPAGHGNTNAKGKGREGTAVVVVQAEVGPGGAGFLCMGGHWTERSRDARWNWRPQEQQTLHGLRRQGTASTVDSVAQVAQLRREEGFYAWTQKGYDDWRVFWLGGTPHDPPPPPVSP